MEFVTIEIRPLLQSCNVFVSLLEDIDPSSVRVKLNKDFVNLRVGDDSYNLCLVSIRIIPTSLSSLRVSGDWVSFRLQTTPLDSTHGSFQTELLSAKSFINGNSIAPLISTELPPKDANVLFSCSSCENVITKIVRFKKVLPLPNDDCEPSDWFCCSHNGDDYSKLLEPREHDYFYGPYYGILSRSNFTEKLKINSEAVVCDRCLEVIGVPNGELSLKVWNCCVEYSEWSEDRGSKSQKRSNALADFKAAIINSSDDSENDGILLEAKGSGITRYLLLKPMEWNLNILVEPPVIRDIGDTNLVGKRVVKILYDYGETKSILRNDWTDARHVKIGMRCMLAGMEHLIKSSKRIPPIYRNVDEHHIGYMNLEMSDKI